MTTSALTVLREYASRNPATLPPSILFSHSLHSIVVYDAYPKSIFHFLVLPRIDGSRSASNLSNLWTLLGADRERTKSVINALRDDAAVLQQEIEDEMVKRYGFKWGIWVGFHSIPSMEHLHLHVLSADLCSTRMKHKKHYNSFHPKLGFFIDLTDVLSWFDATPSYYAAITKVDVARSEAILREPLACFECNMAMKNIPELKKHLQMEQNKRARSGKAQKRRATTGETNEVQTTNPNGDSEMNE